MRACASTQAIQRNTGIHFKTERPKR
jgi:hypothetical protein